MSLQESFTKFKQQKDTNIDKGKVHVVLDSMKQEGVKIFNKLFKKVYSIKIEANSSQNKLNISMQNSYSNFSKNMEHSNKCFCHNMYILSPISSRNVKPF